MKIRKIWRMARLACAALIFACGTASGQGYTAYDLGSFGGTGFDSSQFGQKIMNASGQVLLNVLMPEDTARYVLTGANGVGATDLAWSSPPSGLIVALNNAGQVAGSEIIGSIPQGFGSISLRSAFLSGPGGVGRTNILAPGTIVTIEGQSHTVTNSGATALNALGQVTGSVQVDDGRTWGFVTGPNGVGVTFLSASVRDAGGNLVVSRLIPTSINDAGQLAGVAPSANVSFFSDAGGANLRTFASLRIVEMNASGQLLGVSAGQWVITGPGGEAPGQIGNLVSGLDLVNGINAAGQIVGQTGGRAFVTGPKGVGVTDLNTLVQAPGGLTFLNAYAINDAGQILSRSTDTHVYLLTPVPEPESTAMLLAGLAAIGFATRRRRPVPQRRA